MGLPDVGDRVRLIHDIPEAELHRGESGVVQSTWFAPIPAYEVEFERIGLDHRTRVVVLPEQIELQSNGAGAVVAAGS